jgi:hypothetical protein
MLAVALSATAAGLAVTGAFVMLFRKASCARDAATIDENWLNEFSIARYRPMERLLSDDDYRFLESQPAFNPRLEKKLRTERRAIFSSYLGYLAQDFERLYRATQSLALASAEDRPDLAIALLKQRWGFVYGMAALRCRLFFHVMGTNPAEVQSLVNSLDALQLRLRSLAPAQAFSAAAC